METIYARREPSTDWYLAKYAPSAKKMDVQTYKDQEAIKLFGRFMWYQNPPRRGTKKLTLNCYRWNVVWLKDKEA
jgi:hypothetical protein